MEIKRGDYITRNGSRVTIHEVQGNGSFNIKGQVWRMFQGSYRPRTYAIWKSNGQFLAVGDSPLDIIDTWSA